MSDYLKKKKILADLKKKDIDEKMKNDLQSDCKELCTILCNYIDGLSLKGRTATIIYMYEIDEKYTCERLKILMKNLTSSGEKLEGLRYKIYNNYPVFNEKTPTLDISWGHL